MNIRLIVFLTVVLILVIWAVIYDINREQPWDSDVFFSSLEHQASNHELSQDLISS